jgi:hypothetical protein
MSLMKGDFCPSLSRNPRQKETHLRQKSFVSVMLLSFFASTRNAARLVMLQRTEEL